MQPGLHCQRWPKQGVYWQTAIINVNVPKAASLVFMLLTLSSLYQMYAVVDCFWVEEQSSLLVRDHGALMDSSC
jgi:hypothetical protein